MEDGEYDGNDNENLAYISNPLDSSMKQSL